MKIICLGAWWIYNFILELAPRSSVLEPKNKLFHLLVFYSFFKKILISWYTLMLSLPNSITLVFQFLTRIFSNFHYKIFTCRWIEMFLYLLFYLSSQPKDSLFPKWHWNNIQKLNIELLFIICLQAFLL